jgi:DNA-directed RNA polymerase subunit beta'
MVLGLYYLTKERKSIDDNPVKGEGRRFYSAEEVIIAYNEGQLDLHAGIECRVRSEENGEKTAKRIKTTVGRVLFNQAVPEEVPYINELLTKRNLKASGKQPSSSTESRNWASDGRSKRAFRSTSVISLSPT